MPPTSAKIIIPSNYNVLLSAQNEPANIDDILLPVLVYEPEPEPEQKSKSKHVRPKPKSIALSKYLEDYMEEYVKRPVTPELLWGGDPSRTPNYYRSCFIGSVMIGRAYTLLWYHPLRDRPRYKDQLNEIWKIMQDIFIKALFSGKDPEPGARLSAGYLILTCSKALEASEVQGRGKGHIWYYGNSLESPNAIWTWDDLKDAIFATKDLPRNTSKVKNLMNHEIEYVPDEVLKVMDQARDHLGGWENRQDFSSAEVTKFFTSQ